MTSKRFFSKIKRSPLNYVVLTCEKTLSGKIFSKKYAFERFDRQRGRISEKDEKFEQLEQSRKKHLKAHSTGYQRYLTDFELPSVSRALEIIKGQNSVF